MYDISATVKWNIFTSENYFCKTLVFSWKKVLLCVSLQPTLAFVLMCYELKIIDLTTRQEASHKISKIYYS